MARPGLTCSAAVLILAATAASARAQPAAPDDADLALRLDWLERVLDREAEGTKLWRSAWVGFFGAAVLFEGTLLATGTSAPARVDAGVNVGKAAIAFTFTLASPATAPAAAAALRASPEQTRAQRLARLRLAESLLQSVAAEERDRRGWFGLIGGALVNTAGGVIEWRATSGGAALGWLGVASGLLVSQVQFHTQPTGAIRAWEAYRRAGAGARLGAPPAVLRWSIGPTAGGMAVSGAF